MNKRIDIASFVFLLKLRTSLPFKITFGLLVSFYFGHFRFFFYVRTKQSRGYLCLEYPVLPLFYKRKDTQGFP